LFLKHPLRLVADADRLRQAVANLLGNAIKYTPEGGTVWVDVTQQSDEIIVRVQDTGIGIAPHVLPGIFDLFTQEPRARNLVPGGLGIGLAVVREIAELHGGLVQARSGGLGKGSEFALRLPCSGPGPRHP
jgi:signal transduction histidine kinase